MLISERIFERLDQLSITQKDFSQKTGIRQSTISGWKANHTNPSADKIMIICEVLEVTPEWLLSGTDTKEGYRNQVDWYVIDRKSDLGCIIEKYNKMDNRLQGRIRGYVDALAKL